MKEIITNYNTIGEECALRCERVRRCLRAGISPHEVVLEAATGADINYGGCMSEDGPELLPDGSERCKLPSDMIAAVAAYALGAESALKRQRTSIVVPHKQRAPIGGGIFTSDR